MFYNDSNMFYKTQCEKILMADYTQPFAERIVCNTAEEKFEEYCLQKDVEYYKYGIDDHPFGSKFYKVNRFMRNTPDYIVMNHQDASFIEVKGFKKTLKMKEKDINSYKFWNNHMNLYYYFYSTTYDEMKFISHLDLIKALPLCETGNYPDATKWDDKMYYVIKWENI